MDIEARIEEMFSDETLQGTATKEPAEPLPFPYGWTKRQLEVLASQLGDRLKREHENVVTRLSEGEGIIATYHGPNRKAYVALGALMNLLFAKGGGDILPPALRPRPAVPKGKQKQELVSAFLNDTQLLDLHFFHCCGHRTCTQRNGRAALAKDEFDFQEAYRFARYGGSISKKLEALGLSEMPGATLYRLGARMLREGGDARLIESALAGLEPITSKLKLERASKKANLVGWVRAYAAGRVLHGVGVPVSGPNLRNAYALLFGHANAPQTNLLQRHYNKAIAIVGAPK